jgi:hypothetical protein
MEERLDQINDRVVILPMDISEMVLGDAVAAHAIRT